MHEVYQTRADPGGGVGGRGFSPPLFRVCQGGAAHTLLYIANDSGRHMVQVQK